MSIKTVPQICATFGCTNYAYPGQKYCGHGKNCDISKNYDNKYCANPQCTQLASFGFSHCTKECFHSHYLRCPTPGCPKLALYNRFCDKSCRYKFQEAMKTAYQPRACATPSCGKVANFGYKHCSRSCALKSTPKLEAFVSYIALVPSYPIQNGVLTPSMAPMIYPSSSNNIAPNKYYVTSAYCEQTTPSYLQTVSPPEPKHFN